MPSGDLLGQRLIAATRLATWETKIARAVHALLEVRQEKVLAEIRASVGRVPIVASIPPDAFGTETWGSDVSAGVEPVAAEIFGVVTEEVTRFASAVDEEVVARLPPIDLTHRLDRMLGHMAGLGQETSDRLGATLTEGVNLGEGIDKLADRIQAVFSATDARAEAIARTETNGAVQGSLNDTAVAMDEAGVTLVKVWIATLDDRVRPSHLGANGQVRAMSDPFLVGGCELRYPCDGESPCASETVNCRCAHIFREPESG